MSKASPPPDSHDIEPVGLQEALEERYLAYALSTIMHRALPDVRDGLKPVHRRLLHAMRLLKLDPASGFKKCARVVGDVIGKYHPHGDQAIYDALVRLAQSFAVRYPLVDGQGNFGNIDGDNAAAMRYTEARLTDVATALLEGIDQDTVDFRGTYDGEDEEPVVLPGNFPNLLANGATGIAVGMATSIPPHNAGELCDAALHLIKFPNATVGKLVDFVPGPDFPTGGVIVEEKDQIVQAYKTGKGGFRLRARWEKEDTGRGSYVIVVTEIPYQVQKSRLIEKIAELLQAKKLTLLADIRDESADDVRVVLEPRSRSVDPVVLMESLFKLTDLETRISLNMNVLSQGRIPKVMNLAEVLREWLEHRKEVLGRSARFRLEKINNRLEILAGYQIAYLNLDEVIRIIRFEDEVKKKLIATFDLTEIQAEAILNMRLRSLRKLEEEEIRKENEQLIDEKKELEALLKSDKEQWERIAGQIREIKDKFGSKTELGVRRTGFDTAPDTGGIDIAQAMIEREPITVVFSEKGWIRALRGHMDDTSSVQFKAGDRLKFAVKAETTDKIVLFATNGRFYTLDADKLPGGRGHGEPVRLMIDLEENNDVVIVAKHERGRKLLLAATDGRGFVVSEDDVVAMTRKGKQVLNVSGAVEACVCVPAFGDHVATIGENRKLLIFPLAELPEMSRGRGNIIQKYKDGGLSDVRVFEMGAGLTWQDSADRTRTVEKSELKDWMGTRAQAGRLPPKGFPANNKFGPAFSNS